jgi:hypothetical protein
MRTELFEKEIKKLDEHLHFVESPQAPDMLGVYYDEHFTGVSIPNGEIYEDRKPEYQNPFGTPHKTSVVATAQVKEWLANKEENIELDKEE